MIRPSRSFDRHGGYRTLEHGRVVIRIDEVRRGQYVTSRIYENHARRVCEVKEFLTVAEINNAPTFPRSPDLPPAA